MLKKIGDLLGAITAILSLSLLFLLAVYESTILETAIFISLAIIFDLFLFISHILLLISHIKLKAKGHIAVFSSSLMIFIIGMTVLMIQGQDPRFLLCLYNALIVIFYGLYFYWEAPKTRLTV